MVLIEIQHLTKVFGQGADRVTALEDVSLRVEDCLLYTSRCV